MSETTANWKKWLLVAFIIVTGGVLLFGPGKKTYHRYKEGRSLDLAKSFFTTQDYRSAALSAQQTLQLNPTNLAACELMAQIAELSQSPASLDWRRRIAEISPSTENKLRLAEAGLRYQSQPFPLTEQILQELAASAINVAFYQVVAAERAVLLRQLDRAGKHLAAATQLAPTNLIYQLNLAMVQLSSTNPTTLAIARARLNSFIADTNHAPAALRALTADRLAHNDLAKAKIFSEQLLRLPQATLADRLQHLTLLKQIQSVDFSVQLNTLQLRAATNVNAAVQMAIWMQGNGLLTNSITWLTKLSKNVRDQPPVLLAAATAFEATEDWPALRQLCARGNWADLDFLRLAFLSRSWGKLGEGLVAQSNWQAAEKAAGNRFGALARLLELTARWRLAEERVELFWIMFQKFPRENWIVTALQQHCYTRGDTAGLRRIFQQLTLTFPDNLGAKNDLAYTSLLLKTNLSEAGTIAAKLHKKNPENPIFASTYAFALHLQKRDAEGLAVMQKFNRTALEQPALALPYGLLLSANGNQTAAEPYLAIARRNPDLLPEEKLLCTVANNKH